MQYNLPSTFCQTHPETHYQRFSKLTDFINHFADWQFPSLNVPALFRQTDKIYEFPMIDRTPVERWSFSRVMLLGDAARAIRPNGSNGASQVIWDAEAITEELVKHNCLRIGVIGRCFTSKEEYITFRLGQKRASRSRAGKNMRITATTVGFMRPGNA